MIKLSKSQAGKLGSIKSSVTNKKLAKKRRTEYNKNPKLCKQCLSAIPYEKRINYNFCKRSCSATYNNNKKSEYSTKYFCTICSKQIEKGRKYCSRYCYEAYRTENQKHKLNSGLIKNDGSLRHIFHKFNTEKFCSACKIKTWNKKPITLELDHIDGNSSNNNIGNLRLLCPNCHSQTNTYKSKNFGKGRHQRKIRYKDGKSY